VLYTTFKFGWGPRENGWSLFAVGMMSALVQGVPAGPLLALHAAAPGGGWALEHLLSACGAWPPRAG
jgi:hypothetical protein